MDVTIQQILPSVTFNDEFVVWKGPMVCIFWRKKFFVSTIHSERPGNCLINFDTPLFSENVWSKECWDNVACDKPQIQIAGKRDNSAQRRFLRK